MKILVNDVITRLNTLISVLERNEYSSWSINEVSRLKSIIERARKPLMPSRAIWDRYSMLVIVLEEVLKLANKPGYEYVLYSSLFSLREHVLEFKDALEKTYFMERAQVALPPAIGFIVVLLKSLTTGLDAAWLYFSISSLSLVLSLFTPILGLLGTGVLGVLFAVMFKDLGSAFTGILLLLVSAMYTYMLVFAGSAKFERQVNEAVKRLGRVIQQGLSVEQLKVEDVLSTVEENYGVEDSGVFRYLNKTDLLRYKAALLVAMGITPRLITAYSNKSHE